MGRAKGSTQRRRSDSVIRKGLIESIPNSVQKSYFMLSDAERGVLNIALEKYRAGQSDPILVGDEKLLKTPFKVKSTPLSNCDGFPGVGLVAPIMR